MDSNEPLQIWPGRRVTLELTYAPGDTERLDLDLVPDSAADFARGFLGESTPLAQAILGRRTGEVVYYQAGSSDRVRVKILAVSAQLSKPAEDLTARREDTLRKAVQQSDETNAVMFASSFSGKWGDYDPNAIPKKGEDEADEDDP